MSVKKAENQTQVDKKESVMHSFEDMIDKKVFIRTVTHYFTGKVVGIFNHNFVILENAAWIADTGRFEQAIRDGVLDEIEPIAVTWYVNMDTVTDFGLWMHALPVEQK
jgi:hypothetical protein